MRTRLAHLPVLAAALVRTLAAYALAKFLAGVRGRNFIVCGILWTTTVPYMNYLFPVWPCIDFRRFSRATLAARGEGGCTCRRSVSSSKNCHGDQLYSALRGNQPISLPARRSAQNRWKPSRMRKRNIRLLVFATGKDVEGCSERFGLSGDRRRLGRAGQCSPSGPAGS